MNDAEFVKALTAGFAAGADGSFDNPSYPSRELRMTWRNGWMAGKKHQLKVTPPMDEHAHQAMLFAWASLMQQLRGDLKWLYAVPNAGKRTPSAGARMRAEGLKAGVPDICLPIKRMGYGCLYIELKRPKTAKASKGVASTEQKEWIDGLNDQGQKALVCYGWLEAARVIEDYLDGVLDDGDTAAV